MSFILNKRSEIKKENVMNTIAWGCWGCCFGMVLKWLFGS